MVAATLIGPFTTAGEVLLTIPRLNLRRPIADPNLILPVAVMVSCHCAVGHGAGRMCRSNTDSRRRQRAYALDSGDKLRILVFGQEALSNSYAVDGADQITMPLIGAVGVRGMSTEALTQATAARLRQGYVREPHVAVEVETYQPIHSSPVVSSPESVTRL